MRLPPLNALRAFEAAARHGGFIGAAEELNVTRGAISRHVKLLEDTLGVPLFRRGTRGVKLTEAGRTLLPALTSAFGQIADAADRIARDTADLRIICPPATSIRWLIPRLDGFRARHPDIRVRLTTDFHGDPDTDWHDYDIGFSLSTYCTRAPEIVVQPLLPVVITPACAPRLLEGPRALRHPEDLARTTLLHESPRHEDWTAWLRAFAPPGVDPASGDDFPNLDMATKAAVMGSGVVMADLVLCREELEAGALVRPFPDLACPSPFGDICLLGHRDRWEEPRVRAFRDWAAELAAEDARALGLTDERPPA